MGIDERDIRRTTEDVHFQLVGPKRGYAPTSSGPVRYRRIAWSGSSGAIGYLWYADVDDAAGYVPEAAAGDDAFNAGTFWYQYLTEARDRGLSPSEAVAEFEEAGVGGRRAGWIVPDSAAEYPSVQELRTSAGLSPSGNVPLRRRSESPTRGPRQR